MVQANQQGIYTQQHFGKETTMVVDSSSVLRVNGQLDITSGKVNFPGSLARGYMDISRHIFGGRQAASAELISSGSSAPTLFWGGLLMPDGAPSLNTLSTADPIMRLQWASAIVVAIAALPIAMSQDISTAGGLTVELYGETVGTASATDAQDCFKINARMGVGDVEMGATHPNFSSTPSWQGITLASGNLTTDQLNLMLVPQPHALRAINLYAGRLSYAKLTS